jgi:hypothetical protein
LLIPCLPALPFRESWGCPPKMTVEELTAYFPKEAGIARYGKLEETELMALCRPRRAG